MNVKARHKARERALQLLYRVDISESDELNSAPENERGSPAEDVLEYTRMLVEGVFEHGTEIDSLIESSSEHWRIKRMPLVDRNVLRIAVYELRYTPDVPYKVVIDEAVELAKRYGSDQSGSFVNGVLDRVYRESIAKGAAEMK